MLTVHHSLALADTTRNMRSTMTMMKYLARTSSEGELNKVLSQNARVEGSLAERRRREGKLRSDQEELEEKMTQGMHSLAMTLQADAHQKALVKARQAQQSRQANAAAEQAARVMGAVAPHRAAARDAALAVVAPKESWAPQPLGSHADLLGSGGGPADVTAAYSVLVAEHSACLAVRPGKYCLRCHANQPAGGGAGGGASGAAAGAAAATMGDGSSEGASSFFGYALTGLSASFMIGTAEMASAAPWTVRQPSGHRACTFATSSGLKLYGSPSGVLAVGEPPRAEFSQFVVIPQYEAHLNARGMSGGQELPSPRPFSSAPRVSGANATALPITSPRPQTALPLSCGQAGVPGGAVAGADDAPLLVRLFHPPSRRFLHVSPHTGVASLQPAAESGPAGAGSPRHPNQRSGPPAKPGIVFELLQQHAPPARFSKGTAVPKPRASEQGGGAPSAGPDGRPGSRGGTARGSGRPVVPMRGFDMSTGALQRQADEEDEDLQGAAWAVSLAVGAPPSVGSRETIGSLFGRPGSGVGGGVGGGVAGGVAAGGVAAGGAGGSAGGGGRSGAPTLQSQLAGGGGGNSLQPSGVSNLPPPLHDQRTAAQRRPYTRDGAHREDETRRTAWDTSQLDLSDVMASGPLKLGALFTPSAGGPVHGGGMHGGGMHGGGMAAGGARVGLQGWRGPELAGPSMGYATAVGGYSRPMVTGPPGAFNARAGGLSVGGIAAGGGVQRGLLPRQGEAHAHVTQLYSPKGRGAGRPQRFQMR